MPRVPCILKPCATPVVRDALESCTTPSLRDASLTRPASSLSRLTTDDVVLLLLFNNWPLEH